MTQPISDDLRRRIVEERKVAKNKSYSALAAQFRVGRATVNRVLRLHRETGTVQPKPHGGGMPLRIAPSELPIVKEVVDANADLTLQELAELCGKRLGRSLSRSTMGRAMVRLRLLPKEEGADRRRAQPAQRRGETTSVSRRDRDRRR